MAYIGVVKLWQWLAASLYAALLVSKVLGKLAVSWWLLAAPVYIPMLALAAIGAVVAVVAFNAAKKA